MADVSKISPDNGVNIYDLKDAPVRNMITDAFSSSTAYTVGDYCIYDNKLYKCTKAHMGTWSAGDFAETTISNQFDTLETNFQDGVDSIYDAVVAKGSTPASKSLADVVTGIGNIPAGITPTGTLNITTNGTKDVTNYASANVQVPASAVCSGTYNVTTNGTKTVTGYQYANVQVPASAVCSGTKSISSNGTYTVTGYASASVNVPANIIYHNTFGTAGKGTTRTINSQLGDIIYFAFSGANEFSNITSVSGVSYIGGCYTSSDNTSGVKFWRITASNGTGQIKVAYGGSGTVYYGALFESGGSSKSGNTTKIIETAPDEKIPDEPSEKEEPKIDNEK